MLKEKFGANFFPSTTRPIDSAQNKADRGGTVADQVDHQNETTARSDAYSCLVMENKQLFFSVAYSVLRNSQDAMDAVQESVIKGWRKLDTLHDRTMFRAWMTRIIINTCKDMLRKKHPVLVLKEVAVNDPNVQDEMLDVQNAVNSLDEKTRICATLFFYEDLPMKEIADLLHISLGTVKSRLYRARRKLRNALEVR